MKAESDNQIRQMLKAAGLYRTRCRADVIKVLLGADRPVTQDEIARELGQGRCNKTSIYRTLASLVEAGLVHRAYMDERASHFELAHNCTQTQCHPHFTCTSCGQTQCLTEVSVPLAKTRRKGFVIERQQVRLEGLCPLCA